MKFDETMNIDALRGVIEGMSGNHGRGGWSAWSSALDAAEVYDDTLCDQGVYVVNRAIQSHGVSLIEDLPKVSAAVWGGSVGTWLTDLAKDIERDKEQGKVLGYDLTDYSQWRQAMTAGITRKGWGYGVMTHDESCAFYVTDDGRLMAASYENVGALNFKEALEFDSSVGGWANGALDGLSVEQTQSLVTAPKFINIHPRIYMHPMSGDVQREDLWVNELSADDDERTPEQIIADAMSFLVEVTQDENGEWVELVLPSVPQSPKPR